MSCNVSSVMHNQQLTSIVDFVLKKYDKSQLNYYIKHTCLVEEKKKKVNSGQDTFLDLKAV